MRFAQSLLLVTLAVGLTGCVLRKPTTANAAPPVPAPAPAPAPAPPPEPVSVPQTTVYLPPPQPLTPEAIATTQQPGEATPPPVTLPRSTPRPSTPRNPTRNVEPPQIATPAPATPPSVEPGRAPFTEVLSATDQKRLQDEANQRIQEAREIVSRIPRARRQRDTTVKRVEAFLTQAEDAGRRGDLRQASELAGRALVLARELKP
jgi:hypothetical protein